MKINNPFHKALYPNSRELPAMADDARPMEGAIVSDAYDGPTPMPPYYRPGDLPIAPGWPPPHPPWHPIQPPIRPFPTPVEPKDDDIKIVIPKDFPYPIVIGGGVIRIMEPGTVLDQVG